MEEKAEAVPDQMLTAIHFVAKSMLEVADILNDMTGNFYRDMIGNVYRLKGFYAFQVMQDGSHFQVVTLPYYERADWLSMQHEGKTIADILAEEIGTLDKPTQTSRN